MKPGDKINVPREAVHALVKPGEALRAHAGIVTRHGDWILFGCPDCDALTQGVGDWRDSVICSGCRIIFRLVDH